MINIYPSIPLLQQDLIGNVNGYYPNKQRGFMFGRAPVVNNVKVDLWEGPTTTYVFPTVGQQMRVVSTSASDTVAGTGIQKLYIHYLDTSYVPHIELVTLNGTTPVNTVATNILRINGIHATQVGANGYAVGSVSLTNLAGTVTYGIITVGNNTARQAVYTVPAGVTGYVNQWQASSGSTGSHFCQIELVATTHDGVLFPGVFLLQDSLGAQNGGVVTPVSTPLPIPAMADVKLSAIADASNANCIAIGAVLGWFE